MVLKAQLGLVKTSLIGSNLPPCDIKEGEKRSQNFDCLLRPICLSKQKIQTATVNCYHEKEGCRESQIEILRKLRSELSAGFLNAPTQ
jgi:hypothetical protein